MSQWYLSYDGNQIGPFDKEQAIAHAQKNPNGYVWREGFAEWLPISQLDELSLSALFGGEGLFFATLHGPGKIWLQSLPFSRLAGRMLQASPQKGGGKGEGSILGSLGGLFDGDG
jgi:hypothetical protein